MPEPGPSTGIQTFEDIVKGGLIYVDKTAYLAKMIESGVKTWFLARPRRFGKSLTVSTLKSIFSGKTDLFKGLAIESRLSEELFAPRPVIHLDMSRITTSQGLERFHDSLSLHALAAAEALDIEVPPIGSASDILSSACGDERLRRSGLGDAAIFHGFSAFGQAYAHLTPLHGRTCSTLIDDRSRPPGDAPMGWPVA